MRDTWHDHPTLTFLDYHKQEDGNLVWETSVEKTKKICELKTLLILCEERNGTTQTIERH